MSIMAFKLKPGGTQVFVSEINRNHRKNKHFQIQKMLTYPKLEPVYACTFTCIHARHLPSPYIDSLSECIT